VRVFFFRQANGIEQQRLQPSLRNMRRLHIRNASTSQTRVAV
jgi:hypothetical protein